ncbi:MAG: hypothetical protein ACREQL_01005 [Candidatus Binatia bacterium]
MPADINEALLEQRVAQLEAIVASLSGGSTSAGQRAGGKPPKPTGLTVSDAPGLIQWEWDDSPIADLLHYRIQISESDGFTNAFTRTTVDPRFPYYEGVSGVTYFARVATVNRSSRASDYTAGVSSEVGLVDDTLLTTANITLQRFVKTSGFDALAAINGATDTETYGPLEVVAMSEDTVVDLKVSLIGLLDVSFPSTGQVCFFTLDLLRRESGGTDALIWTVQRDFSYGRGGSGAPTEAEYIAFPPIAEQPGEGTWEYRFRVTITTGGSNDIQFTGTDLRILALVFN